MFESLAPTTMYILVVTEGYFTFTRNNDEKTMNTPKDLEQNMTKLEKQKGGEVHRLRQWVPPNVWVVQVGKCFFISYVCTLPLK